MIAFHSFSLHFHSYPHKMLGFILWIEAFCNRVGAFSVAVF